MKRHKLTSRMRLVLRKGDDNEVLTGGGVHVSGYVDGTTKGALSLGQLFDHHVRAFLKSKVWIAVVDEPLPSRRKAKKRRSAKKKKAAKKR